MTDSRKTDAEFLERFAASPYRLPWRGLESVAGRSTLRGSWRVDARAGREAAATDRRTRP